MISTPIVELRVPEPFVSTQWTLSPAKTDGKQLGCQWPRFHHKQFKISGRPQAARVKLDRGGTADNGIRDTERQARRGSSKQPQRINKVGPPECAVAYKLHSMSLHTQRIAWESPIFENREKFRRVGFAGRVAQSA